MKAPSKRVERSAAELYQLPLADFTKVRDERARDLRREGLRDEADAVKALRKPNLPAWALNLLSQRQPDEVKRLLEVGSHLREAQEALLSGRGRADLDRATAEERELVAKLTRDATAIAGEGSTHGTGALEERIRGTLHAAALDEQTAAELAAGRLVRDTEAVGLFGTVPAGARARPKAAPRAARKREVASPADKRRDERHEERQFRAEKELASARSNERKARQERDRAAKAAERAARTAREAERRADEARAVADEARARLHEAQRREKESTRMLDRAARAVSSAEKKLG